MLAFTVKRARRGGTDQSFEELLTNKGFSDLQIVCGEKVYDVHCAVVCPQSKVIEAKVERWHFDVGK
jgi:hypothetical protein